MIQLYTVKEVAEILKVNQTKVHELRKAGLLKFIKCGQYKVREQELERFLIEYEGMDVTNPYEIRRL